MALSDSARNAAADAVAAIAGYASLHTGDPGTTGANEVTGGTPAYARKPVTWAAAVAGTASASAAVTFDVPAGTNVTHGGLWSAATGGTFRAGDDLPAPEDFGSQGTYDLTPSITFNSAP